MKKLDKNDGMTSSKRLQLELSTQSTSRVSMLPSLLKTQKIDLDKIHVSQDKVYSPMVSRYKQQLTDNLPIKNRILVRKIHDGKFVCEQGHSLLVAYKEFGVTELEVNVQL